MSLLQFLLLSASSVLAATNTPITALPTQSTSFYSASGQATLSAYSHTFPYTVTTATTVWAAPTFPAGVPSTPFSLCSTTMCPSLNGQRCVDSLGDIYGVVCDVQFSGVVITVSGKKMMMEKAKLLKRSPEDDVLMMSDLEAEDAEAGLEKRTYAGSFDSCAMFCGAYSRALCRGVVYDREGYCMAYDKITGSFNAPGSIAVLRQ